MASDDEFKGTLIHDNFYEPKYALPQIRQEQFM